MKRSWLKLALILVFLVVCTGSYAQMGAYTKLNFVCSPNNDLYRLFLASGQPVERYETVQEAEAALGTNTNLFVLADGYPFKTVDLSEDLMDSLSMRNITVFAEFVGSWPYGTAAYTMKNNQKRGANMRAVVMGGWLHPHVKPGTLLSLNDCVFMPLTSYPPLLAFGDIAGFEVRSGDLPQWIDPRRGGEGYYTVLGKSVLGPHILAGTKLSHLVSGRYEPNEQWRLVWQGIIKQVTGHDIELPPVPALVKPAFGKDDSLPEDYRAQTFQRAVEWYFNSRLLVHPDWPDSEGEIGSWPGRTAAAGDGTLGILDGFASAIEPSGTNMVIRQVGSDSIAETAMALAFASNRLNDARSSSVSENLLDYLFIDSGMTQSGEADPADLSRGLIAEGVGESSIGVYDGDGNARALLAAMAAASLLNKDDWNEHIARGLLANLRLTGEHGLRAPSVDRPDLSEGAAASEMKDAHPHHQAYTWAAFLSAYRTTGYEPFLDRAKNGIETVMGLYGDNWRWPGSLQQERARLLLPLAWLVRVEDTQQHRDWLRLIGEDLLALQDQSGAIGEEVGVEGGQSLTLSACAARTSCSAPVIHYNGDTAADLLNTVNFAFLGLHEAFAATGDAFYKDAHDKLAGFICRAQISSLLHPELEGSWFRAFDFAGWRYWGADVCPRLGAWSVASGKTHGWIAGALAMSGTDDSLWDLSGQIDIKEDFETLVRAMLQGTHIE